MKVKILPPVKLWEMKRNQQFFSYLMDRKGLIQQQSIISVDTVKLGGFLFLHPQFARIDESAKEASIYLNENEEDPVEVQLVPYTYVVGRNGTKVTTKILAIECDPEKSEKIRESNENIW